MITQDIPDIIIHRLPVYLRALSHMQLQGRKTVSSLELGEKVGVTSAQIRKDLSQFGEFGKQGTGYDIAFLIDNLRSILKVDRVWDVAVVGMGDMGHAIARYQGFANRGFRVVMVFDSDPVKIGQKAGGFVIRDMAEMMTDIREAGIRIAMLCVPANAAQEVANKLVVAGVKAILNYAPISLNVPATVHVQNLDPAVGLQQMTFYL